MKYSKQLTPSIMSKVKPKCRVKIPLCTGLASEGQNSLYEKMEAQQWYPRVNNLTNSIQWRHEPPDTTNGGVDIQPMWKPEVDLGSI